MKKIKVALVSLLGTLTFLPAFALAQSNFTLGNGIGGFLVSVGNLLNKVIPLLIGLAVIAFLFGVLRFVFNADKEDKRAEGRNFMIYGLIGIVVMVSVWGLVNFVQSSFFGSEQQAKGNPQDGPVIPAVPTN